LNTSFNMDMLYKYLGWKNSNKSTNRQRASAKTRWKVVNTNAKPQVQNNEFIDGLMGFWQV
jgi:hypothetical protein